MQLSKNFRILPNRRMMDVKKLVCKSVLNVKPYIPGKPIAETKRQLGLKEVIKLASRLRM